MNLRDVESIVKIAEEGNIARAAERLFITPSALTQQLQHLEEEIGTPLFTRSRKGCRLTEAGTIYLESARKLLQIRRDTYNRLQDISETKKGTLSIGLPPERGVNMFRYLYPRFHQRYPDITIRVHEVNVRRQQAMIAEGELDLGFMTLCEHQKTADNYELLHEEEILLAVPEGHPACRLAVPAKDRLFPELDIRCLQHEPFALIFNGSTLREFEDQIFQEAGFAPSILFETARLNTILAMAADNICCGLIPASFACRKLPGIACFTLPDHPSWQQTVSYKKNTHLTKASRFLISSVFDYWNLETCIPPDSFTENLHPQPL